MIKEFQTGVVIGKFYPPHEGHHYLIKTASTKCERLFVLVCWKPEQSVPIHIRVSAIRDIHPEVHVIEVEDNLADDDTQGWADYTIRILGRAPDAVFSSEDYGDGYAKAMGSAHVMVDRNRLTVPCSGTLVRNNPLEHLEWISPVIRAFYVKRICIIGAESTGKTTLAQKLAEHYQTNWVPEYGREYCVDKWVNGYISDWSSDEFAAIAKEQIRREDKAARLANKVLICDTDAFATSIWHERYMNCRSAEVENIAASRRYDIYLLTGDEIPFEQDGCRDGEHIRHWMHERFVEALNETNRPWRLLTGSLSDRIAQAVCLIDNIINHLPH